MDSKSIFARMGKAGIVCSVIMLAGCHELTGGGWIPGANGGKANFGFTAKCVEENYGFGDYAWFYKGQLQYQDKLAGVRFHADLDGSIGLPVDSCEEIGNPGELESEFVIVGACKSQPGKVGGSFMVTFLDEDGPEGTVAGRKMIVQTPDPFIPPQWAVPCTDNGLPYYNEGYVQGGTLKSHGH